MTFNHRLMTVAREAAGLTQSMLANDVGVSQALISKIENGLELPNPQIVQRIAECCDVPAKFFEQPEVPLGENLVDFYHKKRLTLPAKPLKRAQAVANMTRWETLRILQTVELQEVAPFPFFSIEEYGPPETIAEMVRAAWRVPRGPLPNLIGLVEATATPVFLLDLGHEKLSAISMPGKDGRHIIILNGALPPSARRFALAHEVGHLVMHTGTASEDMERDADAFASALLMPAADIRGQLRNIQFRDLGSLKNIWRVSLAALIRRAHDLGAITDRHYRTLNIQLNKLPGGRKREPGEFPAEEPRLMREVLVEHFQKQLGYTEPDIQDLVVINAGPLREKYFGQPARPIRAVGSSDNVYRLRMQT